ncbi:MAG: ECF transporter S component, partial [Bacilli bacterium]
MRNKVIRSIVFDAMFIAIIALMAFVPNVGLITVSPLISFTLLHIPVLVGAAIFGWKRGLIYGIAFGLLSLIQAATQPRGAFDPLFINPLISVLPRALFGLAAGFAFELLRKMPRLYQKGLYLAGTSFLMTLLHTFLVITAIWIVYKSDVLRILDVQDPQSFHWLNFLGLLAIVLGALVEAGIAAVITPSIALPIYHKYPSIFTRKEQ